MQLTKQLALAVIDKIREFNAQIKSNYTDAESMIAIDHDLKHIYCIFCGSDSPKDFILDAKFHKDTIAFINDKPVRVHCGFNESELSIHEQTMSLLVNMQCKYPEYKTIVGGHSLGKSTAELFVYRNFKTKIDIIVTFGGALTGNQEFANDMKSKRSYCKNYRIYNKDDAVPKLLEGKFNYVQTGIPVEIKGAAGHPDSIAAALFNHDMNRNYKYPISQLPETVQEIKDFIRVNS